jgi:hypothetical protein
MDWTYDPNLHEYMMPFHMHIHQSENQCRSTRTLIRQIMLRNALGGTSINEGFH